MEWRRSSGRACWVTLVAAAIMLVLAAPALGYSITGTVTAFGTGQPVTDCELQLWYLHTDGTSWYRAGVYAAPAVDGSYSLDFSNDGVYRVQCYNSMAYADQWWHEVADPQFATAITVPGGVLTGVDFSLHSRKEASSLGLTAPPVCAYGSVSMHGYLRDPGGQGLAGRMVRVEAYIAADWQEVGSDTTDAAGLYQVKAAPAKTTVYRAVFAGDATYEQATSSNAQVTPRVSVTKPSAPTTARTTTTFAVSCLLKPRHTAGTYPLSFQCRHFERGTWVLRKTIKAKAANVTGASRCSARIRLTLRGSWRIVAVHKADQANAGTTSAWRSVAIR